MLTVRLESEQNRLPALPFLQSECPRLAVERIEETNSLTEIPNVLSHLVERFVQEPSDKSSRRPRSQALQSVSNRNDRIAGITATSEFKLSHPCWMGNDVPASFPGFTIYS